MEKNTEKGMIISVASGKGGTGKTTVSASLASVIPDALYLDCDVEEPDGHLMLNPVFTSEHKVTKFLPDINYEQCTFCGRCVEVCEFNALINIQSEILVMDELCHSCKACGYFCPENAIGALYKDIGVIRRGKTGTGLIFIDGLLNVGEVSAVPLIKVVKRLMQLTKVNIIDSPPGTSCSMIETVNESDYCILVTEPTPFGLSDLKLAVDVLRKIDIPFGVVINKYSEPYYEMDNFLESENTEVLMKIPFSRTIAESYSKGRLPVLIDEKIKSMFGDLFEKIRKYSAVNA